MSTIQLFEKTSHALKYSKYRPTYPKSLVDVLLRYLSKYSCSRDTVVDVGCGSGQSTFQLEEHFDKCIGVDISAAQVKEAQEKSKLRPRENVTFSVGSATDIPVESNTVDLVTIAQAWHWIPQISSFYSECKRVLKPNGCLAVYGYGNVCLLNEAANAIVKDFYLNTLKGCWHSERSHIDNEYSEVVLPFKNTERHDLVMPKEMTLSDFMGYVSSWSGYEKYCETTPKNNTLAEMEAKIKAELTTESVCSSDIELNMVFPLFVILGQSS